MAHSLVVKFIATLLAGLAIHAQSRKAELPPATVSGVVVLYAQGTLMLVLDRDGPQHQPAGATLTFMIDNATRIQDRDRPANAAALRPEMQALVSYSDTPTGLLAREVRLMGRVQRPPEETVPKRAPSGSKRSDHAPSSNSNRRGPSNKSALRNLPVKAVLDGVRLQSTNRPGAPGIDHVRSGAPFFVAFYSHVDTSAGAVTITYQCLEPDFKTRGLKIMPACTAEETIPAGFRGAKFRAFSVIYTLAKGVNRDQSVIAAEMAPVVYISKGNEVRKFQRKLVPFIALP